MTVKKVLRDADVAESTIAKETLRVVGSVRGIEASSFPLKCEASEYSDPSDFSKQTSLLFQDPFSPSSSGFGLNVSG